MRSAARLGMIGGIFGGVQLQQSKRVARGRAEAPAVVSLSHFFSEASGMSRSVRENSAQPMLACPVAKNAVYDESSKMALDWAWGSLRRAFPMVRQICSGMLEDATMTMFKCSRTPP